MVKNRKRNSLFVSFTPAVSKVALKAMRRKIKVLKVRSRTELNIAQLGGWLNPIINGWIGYYGRYNRSALYSLFRHINKALIRWARRKYKKLRRHKTRTLKFLEGMATKSPRLFAHWRAGMVGRFSWWERYELRGSRTVLREAAGEVPVVYSPQSALYSGCRIQWGCIPDSNGWRGRTHGAVSKVCVEHT